MEPGHYLISKEGRIYISISEKLRNCMEVKLDELYTKGKLDAYVSAYHFKPVHTDEELAYILMGLPPNDERFARLVCQAVKTWYGMYYDDRRSVLEKFNYYCMRCVQYGSIQGEANLPFIFTKVLVAEFTTELSDAKWSLLVRHHQQGFSANGH